MLTRPAVAALTHLLPCLQIVGPHYGGLKEVITNVAFTMDTMLMLHEQLDRNGTRRSNVV